MRQSKQGLVRMAIFLVAFAVSSCTFVPAVMDDPDNAACNLVTHKRGLALHDIGEGNCQVYTAEDALACLGVALVYSTATVVISGSLVLVGNTIHWLEKQGKCPQEVINQQTHEHNAPLLKEGGKLLKPEPEVEL